MSCILFYSPFDQRSRDTESLMIGFKKQGHRVISLSQSTGAHIHDFLRSQGIETFTYVVDGRRGRLLFIIKHLLYFIRFCSRHKVDVVYSHLESPSFVAAIGQFMIRARVFICRHHIDEAALYGFNKSLTYRLTYSLAKKIIVVSERARQFMIEEERIQADKIIVINLAYDFDLFRMPDAGEVRKIKAACNSAIILLTVSRLTTFKRPELSIHVLQKVVAQGINARLILLGRGEDEKKLISKAAELSLSGRVILPGYVSNVTDYLSAADFLLHPSILESSCVAVKEAAITRLPVIVCRDVGDFNDYLIHEENAFLTDRDSFTDQAASIIVNYQHDTLSLEKMSDELSVTVKERFNLKSIISQYEPLNTK